MKSATRMLALVLLAPLAVAQDSVSKYQALPGDAINSHDVTDQINDFALDLFPFESSWEKDYQIGILSKTSLDSDFSPVFFNHLMGAQALSNNSHDSTFLRNSYGLWNAQGQGISADVLANDAPGTTLNTTGFQGRQFSAAFAEFGGVNETVITSVVNYLPSDPQRLYVSRVVAASNSPHFAPCELSNLGIGGVDSHGNVSFRSDAFNGPADCTSPLISAIVGANLFSVSSTARVAMQNIIHLDNTMLPTDVGATNWVLRASGTTHGVPNILPQSINGTRSVVIGSNFNDEYVYEGVAGGNPMTGTTAHRPACAPGGQRGNVSYSHTVTALGAGGTCAMIGDDGANTTNIFAWGVALNGAPGPSVCATLPVTITDLDDGAVFGAGALEFDHYHSQVAFQGGSGQVAIGSDQTGRVLLAAEVDHPVDTGSTHPNNLIAVARITGGGAAWTVAGHATGGAAGKAIFDAGGTSIGQMVTYEDALGLPLGTDPRPSVSAPAFDSVGNVYFLSFVQIFGTGPMGTDDFGVALLRGNYDEANLSYRLEKIFEGGDVFTGLNSGTPYQIQFLSVVDGNSVSSSTMFSGNVNQDAYNGIAPGSLDPDDSRTLGGIVINANIVYDVNGDGAFDSFLNGMGSPDEEYQVMLYVSGLADCNGNGVEDSVDISSGTSPDANGNGIPDECDPSLGTPFCFGVNCPCGNDDLAAGCVNSTGAGARLDAVAGTTSVVADDLLLRGSNCPPMNSGLWVMGGVTFAPITPANSEGLICSGGLFRFIPSTVSAAGNFDLTNIISQAPAGQITPGDTRYFTAWTRDVLCGPPPTPCPTPCGAGSNLTNGLEVLFTP